MERIILITFYDKTKRFQLAKWPSLYLCGVAAGGKFARFAITRPGQDSLVMSQKNLKTIFTDFLLGSQGGNMEYKIRSQVYFIVIEVCPGAKKIALKTLVKTTQHFTSSKNRKERISESFYSILLKIYFCAFSGKTERKG